MLYFFSARGIADGEISDSSKGERDVKIAMLERSERSFFLCDRSKEGKRYPFRITDTDAIAGTVGEA